MGSTPFSINLPIASKLVPYPRNWMYLAEVAVLTRLATGIMRVLENRPSQQKNPNLSPNEKRQALMERFFVEIVGTIGYMGCLHLGQDLVNTIYGKVSKLELADLTKDNKHILEQYKLDVNRFDDVIKQTFGTHAANGKDATFTPRNLIARVLYGETVSVPDTNGKPTLKTFDKANLVTLKNNFMTEYAEKANHDKQVVEQAFSKIIQEGSPIQEFARKNNRLACGAILAGVALSAAIGGSVIQWMNDSVVAPSAKKWLGKHYKNDGPKSIKKDKPATPAMSFPPSGFAVWAPMPPPQLNMVSPSFPPPLPPFSPVYLPNPKMQPPASAFAMNALAAPYAVATMAKVGGGI